MSVDRPVALSRRTMLGAGAALGVAAPLAGLGALPAAATDQGHDGGRYHASVKAAVGFLQQVTDAYGKTGARIVQSFDDTRISDIGFIYDNALTSIALLSAGDLKRARQIADGLLYAQNHDETFTDGRLRQAYHADTFVNGNGTAHFGWEYGLTGTAVGDMSWSGLALAQLARATGKRSYLDGAVRIGTWIFDHTYSTTGLGGYTFGETGGLEDHKSTEHNIDVYGFFRLLAILTRDAAWTRRAQHAWEFITRVWNSDDGFFWTGSDDGTAINKNPVQLPLDVQTWYWLSVGKPRYGEALDWAKTNLATTDTPLRTNSALTGTYSVSGVGFGSGTFRTDVTTTVGGHDYTPKPDDGAVWFEGTGQLALALASRREDGDRSDAAALLAQIRSAQSNLGKGQKFNGKTTTGGVVASSSPLDTGFGFDYSPNLHIGATSWYVFAATGFNPYRFN
ncbi:MAG: uncharacterized protein JWP61_1140 [Friedmanniella sp.]|nr:uncharacterized protein [Friedmanniella sp.]